VLWLDEGRKLALRLLKLVRTRPAQRSAV
jgi:hypothetical protein